jgi:Arc/MetJ-type ribon-helix-helix transcriptional regulator
MIQRRTTYVCGMVKHYADITVGNMSLKKDIEELIEEIDPYNDVSDLKDHLQLEIYKGFYKSVCQVVR